MGINKRILNWRGPGKKPLLQPMYHSHTGNGEPLLWHNDCCKLDHILGSSMANCHADHISVWTKSCWNRPICQIPQCTREISHNAPFCNRNILMLQNAGIILWMCPANERWRYHVTSSLIGWAHSQNDLWKYNIVRYGTGALWDLWNRSIIDDNLKCNLFNKILFW